jgi:hypothetical protein
MLRTKTWFVVSALTLFAVPFLVIAWLDWHPSVYADICYKSEGSDEKQCAPYHVMLVPLWHVGEFIHHTHGVWTALATAFIAWFTWTLRNSTDRLWKTTVEAERPWVGPITVSCDPPLTAGQIINAMVVIRNTGRTPALEMRVGHMGVILNAGVVPDQPDLQNVVPKALFPNAADFYPPFHGQGPLTQAEFTAIDTGTRAAWIVARIEYLDGRGEPHHTNICTRWVPARKAFVPEENNDAD